MDERIKELLSRGREHYQKREFDKADYILREVIEHADGFADVFDMLGVIAHSRGDLHAAARYFERAVSLNPSYTEALLNLAVTYNDLGRYEAARQIHSKVRKLGSAGPDRRVAYCAAKKLATFAMGTDPSIINSCALRDVNERFYKSGSFLDFYRGLATSTGFATRNPG